MIPTLALVLQTAESIFVSVASERRGDSYVQIPQANAVVIVTFQSPRSGEVIPTSLSGIQNAGRF